MLLYMCIIIVIVSRKTEADHIPKYSLNVGTVLFNPIDAAKAQWSRSQLCLLQARKHFQTILPPPDFMDSFNDDYVHILLDYIRESFSNIKREAMDLETDSVMTAALSDTLGGYFKAWILPIAKLDYYGGTISQDNIIKLYTFYNEIKTYLDTDGEGWHLPDDKFINYISINIAQRPISKKKNACNQFAFFEKTSRGLRIPLPTINWNGKSSTLFVPLKNVTLIPMIARDTSDVLIKYYDTAVNCLMTSDPADASSYPGHGAYKRADAEEFGKKFQSWLLNNVAPHLKDEHLYLALGNVLSLLNISNYYNDVALMDRSAHRFIPNKYNPEVPSKKTTIILIILFLEIVWCIPAVIYLLCFKKKRDSAGNVYLFMDQNKPGTSCQSEKKEDPEMNVNFKINNQLNTEKVHPGSIYNHPKDLENPYSSTTICRTSTVTSTQKGDRKKKYHLEFEGQFPSSNFTNSVGTGSQAFCSFKNQSSETIRAPPIRHGFKRLDAKKRPESPRLVKAKHVPTLSNPSNYHVNSLPKKSSHSKSSNRENISKNALRKQTDRGKVPETSIQNKSKSKRNTKTEEQMQDKKIKIPPRLLKTSGSETVKKSKRSFIKTTEPEAVSMNSEQSSLFYFTDTPVCPRDGNLSIESVIHTNVSKNHPTEQIHLPAENKVPPIKSALLCTSSYTVDKKVIAIKSARLVQEYITSISKTASLDESENTKQYFEMPIQEPVTDVCVNIDPAPISEQCKRSRIPKPSSPSKLIVSRISDRMRESNRSPENKRKSLIPQPKKKTLDDMALTSYSCRSIPYRKFNDTF